MGTNSSSKSCSIMVSSRPHLRVWYGKVSWFLGPFLLAITAGKGKRYAGCGMRDAGCGMRDAGCGERRAFPRIASRIPHPRFPPPSFQVPQILPQFLPRAVDVRLHRTKRELHDFRDLVVRVILDVAQDDAGAILGPEFGDRLFDLCPELSRLQLLEG